MRLGNHSARFGTLAAVRPTMLTICNLVTPEVAPQTAKKLRSALKSMDGAIRHAERMADAERRKRA